MLDLPGYRIGRLLGKGGMGCVYEGVQLSLDRRVAVKVLSAELSRSASFVTRFRREVDVLARLRHPHIVRVLDSGVAGEVAFFAMEYCADGTLEQRLEEARAGRPFEADRAAGLVARLAGAVALAHDERIVHRDIKSANVLFDGERVVLGDFGLARDLEATNITARSLIIGSPLFMSPEARRGEELDVRADVWQLGLLLKLALEQCRDAPPELAAIVMACTAERREDRPATALAVSRSLAPFVDPATRGSIPYDGRPMRRTGPARTVSGKVTAPRRKPGHALPLAIALSAALAGAGALAVILTRPGPAPPLPVNASPPPAPPVPAILPAVRAELTRVRAMYPGPVLEVEYTAPVELTISAAGTPVWRSEMPAARHRATLRLPPGRPNLTLSAGAANPFVVPFPVPRPRAGPGSRIHLTCYEAFDFSRGLHQPASVSDAVVDDLLALGMARVFVVLPDVEGPLVDRVIARLRAGGAEVDLGLLIRRFPKDVGAFRANLARRLAALRAAGQTRIRVSVSYYIDTWGWTDTLAAYVQTLELVRATAAAERVAIELVSGSIEQDDPRVRGTLESAGVTRAVDRLVISLNRQGPPPGQGPLDGLEFKITGCRSGPDLDKQADTGEIEKALDSLVAPAPYLVPCGNDDALACASARFRQTAELLARGATSVTWEGMLCLAFASTPLFRPALHPAGLRHYQDFFEDSRGTPLQRLSDPTVRQRFGLDDQVDGFMVEHASGARLLIWSRNDNPVIIRVRTGRAALAMPVAQPPGGPFEARVLRPQEDRVSLTVSGVPVLVDLLP